MPKAGERIHQLLETLKDEGAILSFRVSAFCEPREVAPESIGAHGAWKAMAPSNIATITFDVDVKTRPQTEGGVITVGGIKSLEEGMPGLKRSRGATAQAQAIVRQVTQVDKTQTEGGGEATSRPADDPSPSTIRKGGADV